MKTEVQFDVSLIYSKLYALKESNIKRQMKYVMNKMREMEYDIIGVKDDNETIISKYLSISGEIKHISLSNIISSNQNLENICKAIEKNKYLFVFAENGINGIVNAADLDRYEYKLYIFMLISKYENIITKYIRKKWDINNIRSLSQKEIKSIQNRAEKQRKKGTNLHIVYYMQFSEKICVLEDFSDNSHKYLCPTKTYKDSFIEFRNNVAHGKSIYNNIDLKTICDFEDFLLMVIGK
jgi:hypothetical protein